jgi:2-haloacid dehalogenase
VTPIDAVLLDLGNVLIGWDPVRALSQLFTADEVDRFLAGSDFWALNRRLDAGLPFADAEAELAARDPWLAGVLATYRREYPRALTGPVPGMDALVDELRGLGLRLVGLTNWSVETFSYGESAASAIGRLDGVVVSGEEGVIKPDPRIFAIAARRYALVPARTVFVDDHQPNVDAARGLGYRAVLFTGAGPLRAALRALGVPVRP